MNVRIPKQQNPMGGGNMQAMLKQAQKMQEDMQNLQADLETREYEVSAGGGMVTIKINGKKEILSIHVNPEIIDPDDVETLEDIMTAAVNEAIKRVENEAAEEMAKITGPAQMGLGSMPGLF